MCLAAPLAALATQRHKNDEKATRELRCTSLPALHGRGVVRLRGSQLGCPDGDAAIWGPPEEGDVAATVPEAASYTSFGVLLALIGVVFLMVLYLKRRGIKRWLGNLHAVCHD